MTTKDRLIVWEDEFELGSNLVNAQHKQLVGWVNQLGELHYGTTDTERLLRLNYHIKLHFEAEEQYLRVANFRHLEAHAIEHQDFYSRIQGRILDPYVNRNDITKEIAGWFSLHLEAEAKNDYFRDCLSINRLA